MRKLGLAALSASMVLVAWPAHAWAQTAANQKFTIIKLGPGPGSVVATGVINGFGQETDNASQVPRGRPFSSVTTFADGDLTSTIIYDGPPDVRFDTTTCVTRVGLTDHFVVTGGAGRYAGATGVGTDDVHVTEVAGRRPDGTCLGPDTPPVFSLTIVRSTGTITLA